MKKRKRNHQVVNNFDDDTFESHLKLFKNSNTNILHSFKLKEIEPKTENQEKTLRNFYDGRNLRRLSHRLNSFRFWNNQSYSIR